jgi:hypothetical protein
MQKGLSDMRPTDALKAHRRTMEEMRLSFDDMCRDEEPPPKPWTMDHKFGLIEHFQKIVRLASTFYVSADMMALLEASWPSLPDGLLSDEEYPDECGYMIYDRPLQDVPTDPESSLREPVQGYMWVASKDQIEAYPLAAAVGTLPDTYWPVSALWHVARHASDDVLQRLKPLRATWAFMRQKLAVTSAEPADRAERRRCAKLGLPQEVNVVRVRKHEHRPGDIPGQRDVEWSHRWLVAGHWRQQACGPNREDRRPTWISSHIKGPDDLPLVLKDRVTAWVR